MRTDFHINKISGALLNKKTEKIKIILLYRYFSLAITSIFYMFLAPHASFFSQVGIIAILFIIVVVTKDLLSVIQESPIALKRFVIVETLGIALLLLPTGGIESPFIWYAMNPVLIAATFLSGVFCWGLLLVYVTGSTALSYTFFMDQSITLHEIISNDSYLFLVFILITAVFRLFGKLTNELQAQAVTLEKRQRELLQMNKKLMNTNAKLNDSIEHIMSLYQSVEFITAQENPHTLVKTILDFTEKLTKPSNSFCWVSSGEDQIPIFSSSFSEMPQEFQKLIIEKSTEENEWNTTFTIKVFNKTLQIARIQSTKYYGYIGIEKKDDYTESNQSLLKFLAELSSVILERFYLKEASDQFLIVEEQNRIANEIHDSVSQRVFGIVYGLHSLKKKIERQSKEKVVGEIQLLSNAASMAMNELRSSIYQLSTRKRGENLLISKVKEFLNDVSQLHDISVTQDLEVDEEVLNFSMKKAIYRIICEASGNALKHGKCKSINVSLHITNEEITLSIADDGIGFDASIKLTEQASGIGIRNMKALVHSFGGNVSFQSRYNQGTNVQINIPLTTQKKEVVGL